MRISLLGVGLIGGSIARALRSARDMTPAEDSPVGDPARQVDRRSSRMTVVGWTPNGEGAAAAHAAGVVDDVARDLGEAIDGADLVVLAAPPLECLGLIDTLANDHRARIAPGALITDVASTKAVIVERAAGLGLPFVGGHPMAGRESSGFGAATADLFVDRPWVIVPGPSSPGDGADRVGALARACGGRPIVMSALDHDEAVAAVSHLPLVLAVALVEAVAAASDWPTAAGLAASGWASMTRLAGGDPGMGAGIIATNGRAIADRLATLRAVLADWERELSAADSAHLEQRLAMARERLQATATAPSRVSARLK